ncbi:hypothetical protein [Nocardia sp. NBC_00416]|uniref:hypothetical protein n=1 Tax=Nocardia sp. NBC_00416 TaxID=2975991 RepID=UPI002E1B0AC3
MEFKVPVHYVVDAGAHIGVFSRLPRPRHWAVLADSPIRPGGRRRAIAQHFRGIVGIGPQASRGYPEM